MEQQKEYVLFLLVENMKYTNFEDYLSQKFAEGDGQTVLDDEFPDAFDEWLQNLSVDEFIEYGDMYKKES